MARTLNELKASAKESTDFRGHHLGEWQDNGTGSQNTCLECGKQVQVLTDLLPNDIEIGGEAVAIGCTDPSDDTWMVPFKGMMLSLLTALEAEETIRPEVRDSVYNAVSDYAENNYGND